MKDVFEIQFQFRAQKLDATQQVKVQHIQTTMEQAAKDVLEYVPEGENRERILRHLLDVKFWCVQEISHSTPPAAMKPDFNKPNPEKTDAEKEKDKKGDGKKE